MQLIHPQTYERGDYNYGSTSKQDPRVSFVPPFGIDNQQLGNFKLASQTFRLFDRNRNGYLERVEFVRAMQSLGYCFQNPQEELHVFNLIDKDRDGRVDEREFCEYWTHSRIHGYGMQPQQVGTEQVYSNTGVTKGHGFNPLSNTKDSINTGNPRAVESNNTLTQNNQARMIYLTFHKNINLS